MSDFKLDIFTPDSVVVKDLSCDSLLIPTVGGEINVLPGHTHVLSQLQNGILTAKTSVGERRFMITHGIAKVLGDKITILSSASEDSGKIDIDRAKSAKKKAESRLQEPLTNVDMIKFQRKLERANIRLKLSELHK